MCKESLRTLLGTQDKSVLVNHANESPVEYKLSEKSALVLERIQFPHLEDRNCPSKRSIKD